MKRSVREIILQSLCELVLLGASAERTATMKLKLPAIALLAMIVPAQARTPTLTDAEATYLDQLVTAATVTTMHRLQG